MFLCSIPYYSGQIRLRYFIGCLCYGLCTETFIIKAVPDRLLWILHFLSKLLIAGIYRGSLISTVSNCFMIKLVVKVFITFNREITFDHNFYSVLVWFIVGKVQNKCFLKAVHIFFNCLKEEKFNENCGFVLQKFVTI